MAEDYTSYFTKFHIFQRRLAGLKALNFFIHNHNNSNNLKDLLTSLALGKRHATELSL